MAALKMVSLGRTAPQPSAPRLRRSRPRGGKAGFTPKKAVEELLTEAKRGKTRAETMGAMGWMKCPLASTNKRFLINTIKNTLQSPKEQDQGQKHPESDKESEPSQNREETKPKKYKSHAYTPSFRSRRRVSSSPPRRRRRHRSRNAKDKHEKQSKK